MPWREMSAMDGRTEFCVLANAPEANVTQLCRRFGISRQNGYKWLKRYRAGETLEERSRRPARSPKRTDEGVEARIVALRGEHPTWGGRKLRRRLIDLATQQAQKRQAEAGAGPVPAAAPVPAAGEAMPPCDLPSPPTITAILRRHGLIDAQESAKHGPFQRFEHDRPNALWQMDFKGDFATASGRCHPLTVLDDHSRYLVGLQACEDQKTRTVRERLSAIFRLFGLPERINVDNGSPWGGSAVRTGPCFTPLTVWLMRLNVRVSHSRPYHPQTNGKDERLHRTFKADVLQAGLFADLAHCQRAFDRWRGVYNCERPHQAIAMQVPVSRYRVSTIPFPEILPEPQYGPDDEIRKVQKGGEVSFRGRIIHLPDAFAANPVAFRPTQIDGVWQIIFAAHCIAQLDMRTYLEQN